MPLLHCNNEEKNIYIIGSYFTCSGRILRRRCVILGSEGVTCSKQQQSSLMVYCVILLICLLHFQKILVMKKDDTQLAKKRAAVENHGIKVMMRLLPERSVYTSHDVEKKVSSKLNLHMNLLLLYRYNLPIIIVFLSRMSLDIIALKRRSS